MLKLIKLPDLFTLGNLFCGFFALISLVQDNHFMAAVLIFIAVLLDGLDGLVARHTKREGDFGAYLDSLSDMVSFGVAPAMLGYYIGVHGPIGIAILVFFVFAGALRLARYHVKKHAGFIGMPITVNGVIFPLLYFAKINDQIVLLFFIVSGFLMISSLKFKKLM